MSLEQKIEALTEAVEKLTLALGNNVALKDTVVTGKTSKPEKAAITATAQGSSTATETSAPASAPDVDTATEPTAQEQDATTSETEITPEEFYNDKLLPKFKDLLATGQRAKAQAALTKFKVDVLAKLPKDIKVYQDFLVEIGG